MDGANSGTLHRLIFHINLFPVETSIVILSSLGSRPNLLRVHLTLRKIEAVLGLGCIESSAACVNLSCLDLLLEPGAHLWVCTADLGKLVPMLWIADKTGALLTHTGFTLLEN